MIVVMLFIIFYLVLILLPFGIMKITNKVFYGFIYSFLLFILFTYSLNGSGIPHNDINLESALKISAIISLPAFISTFVSIFVIENKAELK